MVTVVTPLQFCAGLLHRQLVIVSHIAYTLLKIRAHLFLRDAANSLIAGIHGDIVEVVEVVEDAHFTKLRHPCKEGKADVAVLRLKHRIESLQRSTIRILKIIVVDGLQQRFIIFVNKDNDRQASLLIRFFYDRGKP